MLVVLVAVLLLGVWIAAAACAIRASAAPASRSPAARLPRGARHQRRPLQARRVCHRGGLRRRGGLAVRPFRRLHQPGGLRSCHGRAEFHHALSRRHRHGGARSLGAMIVALLPESIARPEGLQDVAYGAVLILILILRPQGPCLRLIGGCGRPRPPRGSA